MPYTPHTPEQVQEMLRAIGIASVDELFSGIPQGKLLARNLRLPNFLTEDKILRIIDALCAQNMTTKELNSFLGAGCYEHFIPSLVGYITSKPEFSTAYTPYQPEVSQGTLQAIYEYQSFICLLTGMDVTCASLYDGASALAEAVLMALRIRGQKKIYVSTLVHPEYRQVLGTYGKGIPLKLIDIPYQTDGTFDHEYLAGKIDNDTAAVILQRPNFFGIIEDTKKIAEICHQYGALMIEVVNPLALSVLGLPQEYGVDIVVGDGQPLGQGLHFGGPSFGFLATKTEFVRKIPGRVVGRTIDKDGKEGFVLTLQAREQHIRRQHATSNICSNQSLNALAACVYLACLGEEGFRNVGEACLQNAHYLMKSLTRIPGIRLPFSGPCFNEFVISCEQSNSIYKKLLRRGVLFGFPLRKFYPELKNHLLLSVTELKTQEAMDSAIHILQEIL